MSDNKTSKLEAFVKILAQEIDGGFQDTTVIGGLDRFLHRWADDLKPVLGKFSSYSVLTPVQRETWVQNVSALFNNTNVTQTDDKTVRPTHTQSADSTVPSKKMKKQPTPISITDGVISLKGVSTKILSKLRRLDVEKVEDLLYLFPHRHNDFANICKVSELELGKEQTVVVTVWEAVEIRHGPKRRSTQAVLGDDTGNIRAIWFNNPYLTKILSPNTDVVISGKVNVFKGSFVFESPEYELLKGQEELVHTGRLVPVYPTVEGLPQRTLRRVIKQALDVSVSQVVDYLSDNSRHRTALVDLQSAILQAHYPDTLTDRVIAHRRLAFDELLMLQLAILSRKKAWQQDDRGIPLKVESALLDRFFASLPFELTRAQSRVLNEVLEDIAMPRPMSRLLQGDVGSGKTAVAAAALLVTIFSGYQGALIAPTEILAEQHFLTMVHLLSGVTEVPKNDHLTSVNIASSLKPVTIGLLLGSLSKKIKEDMHKRIAAGKVDLIIGTHALIQKDVELPNLALAIVDEQHRFGVMQRASMRGKGRRPHILAMSATPIPRSLALTLYGELDISVIDELPPGREQIRTRWVKPDRRAAAYNFISKQITEGRQAFIVCPLIEESEAIQARAATKEHARLSRDVFPDLRLGLLHGRMTLKDKEKIMDQFKRQDLDILVSTSVVEVGIDIPNSTVMLVDGAERFGLSQLHQFRGRVGRGHHQSYCLLLSDSPGEEARERLKLVERIQDGFELAEEDLRLRGPGDYIGTRQSGLRDLKVARITDQDILSMARQEATIILDSDSDLVKEENVLLATRMTNFTAGLTDEMS